MNRAIPVARPVAYTEHDLDTAAAAVATTRSEWERHGLQRVNEDDMQAWVQHLKSLHSALAENTREYNSPLLAVRWQLLRVAAAFQKVLGLEDQHLWAVSFLFGVMAVVAVTPFVLIAHPSAFAGVTVFLITFVSVVLVGLIFFLPVARRGARRSLEDMRADRAELREQILDLRKEIDQVRETVNRLTACRRAQVAHERAVDRHRRLEQLLADERYRLQTMDWRALRGIPFEEFLARVFRLLGYEVELTKASGDQGVDLIARGKGRRIAIQSKGYGDSVGNKAVQEAFAGQAYYQCHECVVVTNSQFTSGAIDLAAKVGCELIDGTRIRDLIDGRIY